MSLSALNILFAGSGAFGEPALRRLVERGAKVVGVYTQPSKPAGRGNKLTPTPIAAAAGMLGLPLKETSDINAEPLPPADLLVVIAFGQKLAPHIVDHARLGAINLHASRLPKYRGAAPINWAVINGDPTAGNSVIRLAQTMDAGAVLSMSETPIGELETAGEIHDRLAVLGAEQVVEVAGLLADRKAVAEIEQDHALATKAPKLSRESAQIDFSRDATSIANQIRGMHPWPGCRVRLVDVDGKELDRLTLVRARVLKHARQLASPLQQTGTLDDQGAIRTGADAIEVVELQPDGKRPMSLSAYRNGRRWEAGMRLESVR